MIVNEAPQVPEHDKIKALGGKNNVVGDFLEWLTEQGYVIAQYEGEPGYERLWPVHKSTEEHIADYFGIDRKALNREKEALLDFIRSQHDTA